MSIKPISSTVAAERAATSFTAEREAFEAALCAGGVQGGVARIVAALTALESRIDVLMMDAGHHENVDEAYACHFERAAEILRQRRDLPTR